MLIFGLILFLILGIVFLFFSDVSDVFIGFGIIFIIGALVICIYGCFNGFIVYPKTEGTHQGVITAVDLEGVYFRRYEVYLKSSGYTGQSDETKYLIYEEETELANKLKEAIGKNVKLYYGHDGGYIPWNSCGTYHIKDVEIIEEK